jgi:hypothetical protein
MPWRYVENLQKPCRDDTISSPVKESDISRHRQKPLQKFLTAANARRGYDVAGENHRLY